MRIPSVSMVVGGACAALLTVSVPAARVSSQPAHSGAPPAAASEPESDCSGAYGSKHAHCTRVPCRGEYQSYLGTWRGEFSAYVREKSKPGAPVFRPYHDTITYAADACFTNPDNGDSFILGHRVDDYPAFAELPARQETGLLVTGAHADQTAFLRTVDRDGVHEFALTYRNPAAGLAIWTLNMPAVDHRPEMSFTTIDGRDWETAQLERRDVVITLTVGPGEHPLWRGVIAHGWHAREP